MTVLGLTFEDDLETWVYQTIGRASMLFQTDDGVFDDTTACALGIELIEKIRHEYVRSVPE